MLIFPYSTALTLAKPPLVSYIVVLLCTVIFTLQLSSPITENLMYYPESWNPLKMITASFAHGSWSHLIWNMIFFLAFAPAIEVIIGNTLSYISLMIFIALVTGISYSISTLTGNSEALPSLGFSGVVMGIIGLSAFMMPTAKIRVFWWYIVFWKTFYVPAWILAVIYIGIDSWQMLTASDYNGVNIVAHVAGGISGYLSGLIWLKERKAETKEELEAEIKAMNVKKIYGNSPSMSFSRRDEIEQEKKRRETQKEFDHFMSKIYQMVITHRDSEAVFMLMERYNYLKVPVIEFEKIFEYIEKWGPSRTQLCIGRLVIELLNVERRYGRALYFIEKCQHISPQFILADLSQTVYYARLAIETDKLEVAKNLIINPQKRYQGLVDIEMCTQMLDHIKLA